MRHEVGQRYPFIYVDYIAKHPWRRVYCPWDDELVKIHLIEVECTSHHKVPSYWEPDGEAKYEGFKFKVLTSTHPLAVSDQIWVQQFPTAEYGQVDDSQNWVIRPEERTKENWFLVPTSAVILMGRVRRGFEEVADPVAAALLRSFHEDLIVLCKQAGYEHSTGLYGHLITDNLTLMKGTP